ncbi:MAG: RibD family protein [Rhizobiaceae bacterium]|nr:RibD family protein [Rhizobiaceae bacterium]
MERVVLGQLGQTLDGCIATHTGDSKYINSESGLRHLHELRAVVDAVVVGVSAVNEDNPSLTVRLCEGSNPVRVILDPRGRVDLTSSLFQDGGPQVIVVTCEETDHPADGELDLIKLPCKDHFIDPNVIIDALNDRGYKKILIEGGNVTLSRFMDANAIDRLHLIVAPMIMGAGLPGLNLSPIEKLNQALRPEVTVYPLGSDIVFECDLNANKAVQQNA